MVLEIFLGSDMGLSHSFALPHVSIAGKEKKKKVTSEKKSEFLIGSIGVFFYCFFFCSLDYSLVYKTNILIETLHVMKFRFLKITLTLHTQEIHTTSVTQLLISKCVSVS